MFELQNRIFFMSFVRVGTLVTTLCLATTACRREVDRPRRDPLTAEAYVWQAPSSQGVAASVKQGQEELDALHFRAAELKWNGSGFLIERVVSDRLPAAGCGLVVRIGASAATLEWNVAQCREVEHVVTDLAKLRPAEIQCDYDCPQGRLVHYRRLLECLRKAAGGVPLFPTALPSWLAEPEFPILARESGGFVLQVHSLVLPSGPDAPVVLLDPVMAKDAVMKASRSGVPFRVAMPTYGCEVWFDAAGKVIDVISEDRPRDGLMPAKRSFALTDPAACAALVSEWMRQGPEQLTGIIWYRLPVAMDRRNWPWRTLSAVSRGVEPHPMIAVVRAQDGDTGDLVLENNGEAPGRMPNRVIVRGSIRAADAVGAYVLRSEKGRVVFQLREDVWPWIDPAQKIVMGWVTSQPEAKDIEWELE